MDDLLRNARNKCQEITDLDTMIFIKHVKVDGDFEPIQTIYRKKQITKTLDKRIFYDGGIINILILVIRLLKNSRIELINLLTFRFSIKYDPDFNVFDLPLSSFDSSSKYILPDSCRLILFTTELCRLSIIEILLSGIYSIVTLASLVIFLSFWVCFLKQL